MILAYLVRPFLGDCFVYTPQFFDMWVHFGWRGREMIFAMGKSLLV